MFSLIGTPSAKNYIKIKLPFPIDLFDHAFLDLFPAITSIITPNI